MCSKYCQYIAAIALSGLANSIMLAFRPYAKDMPPSRGWVLCVIYVHVILIGLTECMLLFVELLRYKMYFTKARSLGENMVLSKLIV